MDISTKMAAAVAVLGAVGVAGDMGMAFGVDSSQSPQNLYRGRICGRANQNSATK